MSLNVAEIRRLRHHAGGVERTAGAEARQHGAMRAEQEDRLDEIPPRLLDGERGEMPVVERSLAHDAVDGEDELLLDLRQGQLGHRPAGAGLAGMAAAPKG
jgi:hypothetical protein